MRELQECAVGCPYCGESIEVLVDNSEMEQSYIEDCAVCCRPINFSVSIDFDGSIEVSASSDDE